jgi:nicotinate phosphoribosyltransferase
MVAQPVGQPVNSTAFLTDHYELTMLDAALQAGTAGERVAFEVFTRGLPPGRRYGVLAGVGRWLDALESFRFGPAELDWLAEQRLVSDRTLEWLAGYRFGGDVYAYPEGELYTDGSPVMTVEGTFGESVLLETLTLSILNHDSAVAAAASLLVTAAGGRPIIEMGSRRTDAGAAVAAARAAYLGGFASTSNLEAGRTYGVPTAGTAAHAFTLLFPDEKAAFEAQLQALGPATTLLVDTFDTARAIRLAVEVAGPELGAVRIDSGDLVAETHRARTLLDSLGATATRVIVTGDLDEARIKQLATAPADAYGAGTSVVTGSGYPTAGLIYKLVSVGDHDVAKRSPGKATLGGRKRAWRIAERAEEVVASETGPGPAGGRPLQSMIVTGGARLDTPSLTESRVRHLQSVEELPRGERLKLVWLGS